MTRTKDDDGYDADDGFDDDGCIIDGVKEELGTFVLPQLRPILHPLCPGCVSSQNPDYQTIQIF